MVNNFCHKRLFINPMVFGFYGHLEFMDVVPVTPIIRDTFYTSGIFANCETDDPKVYGLEVQAEAEGIPPHHIKMPGDQAIEEDPDFFLKTFCINNNEFGWYTKGGTIFGVPYTSLDDLPDYSRF